jgi:hypothetical protein
VQKKIQERVKAHQKPAMLSGSGGSAAASDLGSLAAFLVSISRGEVCRREGFL